MVKITMTNRNDFWIPNAKLNDIINLIYDFNNVQHNGEEDDKLRKLNFVKIEMSDEFILLRINEISSITEVREETE